MSEPRRVPSVIAFDAVGTLILPAPTAVQTYDQIGREYGSQLSFETIQTRFHSALREDRQPRRNYEPLKSSDLLERRRWQRIVAHVFRELPHASGSLFDALWEHFAQPQHWRLNRDVAACWEALEQAGWTLGIASNFDHRLEDIVAAIEPLKRAHFVVHSAELQVRKPAREFFRAVQRKLGKSPADCVMVGDDWEADVVGARTAGWHAVWLHSKSQPSRVQAAEQTATFAPCMKQTASDETLPGWIEIERLAQLPACIGLVREARSH